MTRGPACRFKEVEFWSDIIALLCEEGKTPFAIKYVSNEKPYQLHSFKNPQSYINTTYPIV